MSRHVLVETSYILVEGEMHCDNLFLHASYGEGIKFTHNMFKELLVIWAELRQCLLDCGVAEVFSFVTTSDVKINKWQALFGLVPMLETASHTLYRRVL